MLQTVDKLLPVGWLPAGLVSWYDEEGRPLALVIGWMALICGERLRVRSAWPGARSAHGEVWSGGDFILNIPGPACLKQLKGCVDYGQFCLDVVDGFRQSVAPGLAVQAPRLGECEVQVECRNGLVDRRSFEPEISGDVVLLHRADNVLSPDGIVESGVSSLFS